MYIHGFLSAPASTKAQLTARWLEAERPDIQFVCPALSSYPAQAQATLREQCEALDGAPLWLIGSSLGGFWASWMIEAGLAERAVLVNPAVSPHQRFRSYLGRELRSYYTEESFTLTEADMRTLAESESETLTEPERYWLLAQKGDEVLDYRDAELRYTNCRQTLLEGGSHAFEDYLNWMPEIIRFLEGAPVPPEH